MKLSFLGCGSAFNPELGNTSAYFEYNEDLYLLDCGETTFERLMKKVDLTKYQHVFVLITHLHADHVGSLGSLISYYACVLGKKLYVIHPKRTIVELLHLLGIDDDFYYYEEELPEYLSTVKAEAVSVEHVENMDAFGYLLKTKTKCIYYSGDASTVPETIVAQLKNQKIDELYQDTCSWESTHPTHCYIGKLEQLIEPKLRYKVYCMHLDEGCRVVAQNKGFSVVN